MASVFGEAALVVLTKKRALEAGKVCKNSRGFSLSM